MTVYWLDDSKSSMLKIIPGIFFNLWNIESQNQSDQIQNKIYIFGNMIYENADTLLSSKDEENFNREVLSVFREYCDDLDGVDANKNTFKEKYDLAKDVMTVLFKKNDPEDRIELYKEILEYCASDIFQSADRNSDNDTETPISKLVETLDISSDGTSVVGIDVLLLKGDFNRCMDGKFMLSMELCHQFYKRNIPRFLYSMDATNQELMTEWRNIYSKAYPKDDVPQDFLRVNFGERMFLSTAEKIKKMFKPDEDEVS